MSCRIHYKNKIQNAIHSLIHTFAAHYSNSRAVNDDQMECMQFGICSFSPKALEEIPYFHY